METVISYYSHVEFVFLGGAEKEAMAVANKVV